MSLKKNVIANYFGQGWRAMMNLAFIPLYIKYLGIEAYGLIGIFALLQAWLALLDMGMKPTLIREMARFTSGEHSVQYIRDLLRSIEIIGVLIAGLVALGVWAASDWIASDWLTAANLPVEVVAKAFAVMGVVMALRFIENIYVSCVNGLQRQVMQNIVTSIMATLRGLGAVGVLAWVSASIEAFFVWQGIVSLITVFLFAGVVYRTLPLSTRSAQFSLPALIGIWRFAAGMIAITFLALLLTQVDKILLSRLLTLEIFGYYALATAVAHALYKLTQPIATAFYPRFTELTTQGDEVALRTAYHHGSQLVSVLMGSAAIMLVVFGDRILFLWTADLLLTQNVAPLVAVLALGTMFNGLMWIPYHLQLAHGWTSLTIKINIVAVVVLVPAIIFLVPAYGVIVAAWVWMTLNAGYLVFGISFMHRRLLPSEKWRWYCYDVAIPLFVAAVIAGLCRWVSPANLSKIGELIALLMSSSCVLIGAALTVPIIRHQAVRQVRCRIKANYGIHRRR